MEIVVAKSAGFCYGVANAVNTVYALIENNRERAACKTIQILGPTIHNETITEDFKSKGVIEISTPEQAINHSIVVIRAHGVGKDTYDKLYEKDIEIIDATCPYVKKIHSLVDKKSKEGYFILVAGNETHPEVKGICGWANGEAFVINSEEDLQKDEILSAGKQNKKVCLVAQTTTTQEKWDKIIKSSKKTFENVLKFDTICNATIKRQQETADLAKKMDMMVVIGSKTSSNTIKLTEVSGKYCENTYLIERAEDITPLILNSFRKIGVSAGASTPDNIIREVIGKMSEQNMIENGQTFEQMVEDYMDEIRTGKVLTGTVVRITEEGVFVDIGAKAEGMIPITEFTNDPEFQPGVTVKEGDQIEAKIYKISDKEGTITLSKRDLDRAKSYKIFNELKESGEIVPATVLRAVKGGVIARCVNTDIFIPLSLLSDRYIQKADNYIGQEIRIKIISVDEKKRSIKGSAKPVIMEEKEAAQKAAWEKIEVGAVIEGIVKNFTDYRAFVDLGGIDGSIHISEISWNRIKHPSDVLTVGDKVEVTVLDANPETRKISLGLKKAEDNPWFNAEEKFAVGNVVNGTVVRIVPFGAFVELEKGVDALVHISQISDFRIGKVEEALEIGQNIEAKIMEFDPEARKISISIKEIEPINPPERVAEAEEKAKLAEERAAQREEEKQARDEEKARVSGERAAARAAKAGEPTEHVETLNNSLGDQFAGLFDDMKEE